MPVNEVLILVIAMAVSAIPEGLPVAMTVALSTSTARMAKRSVIVRKLTAVESLGSCTVIASDKTGTLTVNEQTVRVIALPDQTRYFVSGQGYNGEGEISFADDKQLTEDHSVIVRWVGRNAVFCNEATLSNLKESGSIPATQWMLPFCHWPINLA
jgi:magnesium-transporting ATPase (P-type)